MINLLRILPLAVLAALLTTTVAWSPAPESPPRDPMVLTGHVTGWQLWPDGTVRLRLEGERDGKEFVLWFATPANQTSTTRFEDHVVEAVLHHFASGPGAAELQITTDRGDNARFGRTPEDALPLSGLSRMK